MQAFRRRRPANQNAVAANNTARQPAVIATTSVSTRSEPLGEPETGEQRGAMAVFLAGLTYFLPLLTSLSVLETKNVRCICPWEAASETPATSSVPVAPPEVPATKPRRGVGPAT